MVLCAFFLLSCNQGGYEISVENIKRIITALAADSMQGRKAFTPGIDKAAAFIAAEFKQAGIEPLQGQDDHLQRFDVFEIHIAGSDFRIGGQSLPDDQFVVKTDVEIHWDSDETNSEYVKAGEDLFARYREITAQGKDVVIFVDGTHANAFSRFLSYLRRPVKTLEQGSGFSYAMVLLDGDGIAPNKWILDASVTVKKQPMANVAGMVPGVKKDEFVIFSAHYDHIGYLEPSAGDSIANGANDDASGCAAVLELARYFNSGKRPERTLLFVTFTAEEMGGYGSQYFSKQYLPEQVVAMFNIEMIGKPATDGPNSAWITGFDMSDLGKLMQQSARGSKYRFYKDPYPQQNLFYRSDNATLARLGVPAHTISTTPIDVDTDYHQVTDHIETLDLVHLTNTVKAIAIGADKIVNGELTPTRVDVTVLD